MEMKEKKEKQKEKKKTKKQRRPHVLYVSIVDLWYYTRPLALLRLTRVSEYQEKLYFPEPHGLMSAQSGLSARG